MKKIIFIISIIAIILTGCNKTSNINISDKDEQFNYYVYYLSASRDKLNKEGVHDDIFKNSSINNAIDTMIELLKKPNDKLSNIPILDDEISIISYDVKNNQLSINFSVAYLNLSSDVEVLVRAAIVKSLIQLDSIQKIIFFVADMPLNDKNGNIIGPMDNNSFVENMGTDINTYQEDTLYLYFADKEYKKLVKTGIKVMRRSNIPREKIILEYLFKGPIKEFEHEVISTIPSSLKLNSIITKNGVCYIDFSDKEVTDNALKGDLILYSIVNSLTEDGNITKVKFSLDANESAVYRGVKLDEAFEKKVIK